MDALVMCGGRGERLAAADGLDGVGEEKPLVRVGGTPMLDRVVAALAAAERVGTTYAVVSPNAPATKAHAADRGLPVVETPGEGYVADLERAIADDRIERPVLTVVADLPLLDGATVDAVLDGWDGGSLAVCVPVALKRSLGVSVDATFDPADVDCATVSECAARDLAPTGLNVVADSSDAIVVRESARLAINVNRPADRSVAEDRCA